MNTNKPKDVSTYIKSFPKETQKHLQAVRETIQKVAPEAEELISYSMPAYKLNGMLVYFAGYEHHIGFYSMPSGNEAFQKEISKYKTGKGSIQFPLDQPMPLNLIRKMVKFRAKENLEKAKVKAASKKR